MITMLLCAETGNGPCHGQRGQGWQWARLPRRTHGVIIVMSEDELLALPVSPRLMDAARAFGMGRNQAYRAARDGTFPIPVREENGRFRVSKFDVLAHLHMPGYGEPQAEAEAARRSA
jgi:hypothetical protein